MSDTIRDASALYDVFPSFLKRDKEIDALANIASDELAKLGIDNELLNIYGRINALDEGVLDILAKDFGVDWYDVNGTIEIKRTQIASLFYVHRHKGTAASVRRAITNIHDGADVSEWFNYSGSAGRFKVEIPNAEKYDRTVLLKALKTSKNSRPFWTK